MGIKTPFVTWSLYIVAGLIVIMTIIVSITTGIRIADYNEQIRDVMSSSYDYDEEETDLINTESYLPVFQVIINGAAIAAILSGLGKLVEFASGIYSTLNQNKKEKETA